MVTRVCPSGDELAALHAGKLDSHSLDHIADHVDTCVGCQAFLETIRGVSGPLVGPPSRSAAGDDFTQEPEFRRGVGRLNDMVSPRATEMPPLTDRAADPTPAGHMEDTLPPANEAGAPTQATQPPLPAQFGRYRILECLGEGGMGVVYLAHDPQLERNVALKIPRVSAAAGTEAVERFYRESRAAAKLDHPNICPVHDVGEVEGAQYLVMAYVNGRRLSDVFRDGNLPSTQEAAALVRKIALALHEAHQHGVVHRDLKPSNIMLNKRGEPIVMDFGLAQLTTAAAPGAERLTQSGVMIGTPAYMSPEQVMGDVAATGPAADIYSLGVILYELLTGRVPFQGPVAAILGRILVDEPAAPSALRGDVDPRLEAICLKAMAKRIDERFRSMDEFAEALAAYLERSPSAATASRRPWARIVAAAGLTLSIILGVVVYRIMTNAGTLVVEIDENALEVEAKLKSDGLIVADKSTGQTYKITAQPAQRFRSGKYRVKDARGLLLTSPHGLHATLTEFEIKRGEKIPIRVTLEPPAKIAATTPPPVAAVPPPVANEPPPAAVPENDHTIAEWVLSANGRVRVELKDGRFVEFVAGADLPDEPFRVDFVFLGYGSKYLPEDVARLKGLSGLRGVQLERYAGWDDDVFVPFRGMTRLDSLNLLGDSQLTGEGLTNLESCTALHTLGLGECRLTDAACEAISHLRGLVQLDFSSPDVTVRGFEHLAKLPNLEALVLSAMPFPEECAAQMKRARFLRYLRCEGISDEALAHLGEFRNLTELRLYRAQATDDGLKHLTKLRNLRMLILQDAPITGSGFAHLNRLTSLIQLDLCGTEIDDPALETISQMSRLNSLALDRTRITDNGIAKISGLSELVDLRLNGAHVSDAGIASLGDLKKLKYLELNNTLVTADGVKTLRAALPVCNILANPPE